MIGAKDYYVPSMFLAVPNDRHVLAFPQSKYPRYTAPDESPGRKRLFAVVFCELTHVGNSTSAPYARQSVQVLTTGWGTDTRAA
jgi:hypothetical protein